MKPDGFCAYVGTHRQLEHRLDEALEDVVRAVVEHEGAGKLSLTITVTPQGDGQMTYKAKVKTDLPRPGVPDSIFFGDADGKLHRSDPRQRDIEDELAARRGTRPPMGFTE